MKLIFLLAASCLLCSVDAARILAIFPIAAKSHFSCNEAIMKSLHAAGHQITLVSPFPSETKVENFTTIDSRFETYIYIGQSSMNEFKELSLGSMMQLISDLDVQYCYDVLKLKEIKEALSSKEKLYDVMFIELLIAYECYLPIAQKLGIPVIGTVTLRSWKLADHTIGIPYNPSAIPLEVTSSKPEMSLFERIRNLWDTLIVEYYARKIHNGIDKFYHDTFTEDLLYKKKISLVFYNNHASLLPRPVIPNAVEIGGIHVKPAQPLPKEFQKFIDEAEHGVILFTFGSVIKASTLPAELREAFVEAFSAIPQRVIWKFEEPIENLSQNVMLSKWLPQRDILEHKNVIAFMSHCGQSGVYEAVITGTPVITIPLFADQQSNAALLHHRGVGVPLDLQGVTKHTVLKALNMIINDTRYYEKMQELSRVFKDRPMTPQESIVYWTEYVIRHNGAPYLKAFGTDMPLYKYLMLDIIALVLIMISAVIYTVYKVATKIHTLVLQKPKYSIHIKNE